MSADYSPASQIGERSTNFCSQRCRIIFIHLDLGIGGAEQLILNLAVASKNGSNFNNNNIMNYGEDILKDNDVWIYTSHCDQSHCFDEVRKPHGSLCDIVNVHGTFIPPNIRGRGTALCSTLRMMYITWKAIQACKTASSTSRNNERNVFVLDVLPSSIPLIRCCLPQSAILFYCHFPDKLLTRDTVNGVMSSISESPSNTATSSTSSSSSNRLLARLQSNLRYFYRGMFDRIEEYTMRYADLILVNSNFTKDEVGKVFPSLLDPIVVPSTATTSTINEESSSSQDTHTEYGSKIKVLYPAIDLNKFIAPRFAVETSVSQQQQQQKEEKLFGPIVSLNRFERKKNIQMLIYAYAELLRRISTIGNDTNLHTIAQRFVVYPPVLVIAGGYDPRNAENREYLQELKEICFQLNLEVEREVIFRPSVSDEERATLLQSASCVCYTPHREHFGIVPLEAMYAGSPVIAVNSGGPMETVVHGVTGFLVENSSDGFCSALYDLIVLHPEKIEQFGSAGHMHIKRQFGLQKFQIAWKVLVNDCIQRARFRYREERDSSRWNSFLFHWFLDAFIAFTLAFCARYLLNFLGINILNYKQWIK
jgi:alpha-1,3/alpha-1,6-mannosyltransferase